MRRPKQIDLRFEGLEQFVNIADGPAEVVKLKAQNRDFFPRYFWDGLDAWTKAGRFEHHYLGWYRNQLRKVWEGRDPKGIRLSCLLGLIDLKVDENWAGEYHPLCSGDPTFSDDLWDFKERNRIRRELTASVNVQEITDPEEQKLAVDLIESVGGLRPITPVLNWRTGEVELEFDCDFRRALYQLFRESWRARVCTHCGRYFIARRPPQLYCSSDCFRAEKLKRDSKYWRDEGSMRRKKRIKKGRRTRSERS